jgi:uncharacterized membrane protein
MQNVIKSIDVQAPARTAYDRCTPLEQIPQFVKEIETVSRVDQSHFRWSAQMDGKPHQGILEITERVPDRKISWRSIAGIPHTGSIRFDSKNDHCTTVSVQLQFQPDHSHTDLNPITEHIGRCVQNGLDQFEKLIQQAELTTPSAPLSPVGVQPEYDSSGKSGL